MLDKIYLTKREIEIWEYVKRFFIEEDQIPTSKALAEYANIGERWAARLILRFSTAGLLEKNNVNGFKFRRGRYEIIERNAVRGHGCGKKSLSNRKRVQRLENG